MKYLKLWHAHRNEYAGGCESKNGLSRTLLTAAILSALWGAASVSSEAAEIGENQAWQYVAFGLTEEEQAATDQKKHSLMEKMHTHITG